jgi:hypothetical protein
MISVRVTNLGFFTRKCIIDIGTFFVCVYTSRCRSLKVSVDSLSLNLLASISGANIVVVAYIGYIEGCVDTQSSIHANVARVDGASIHKTSAIK